jgi:hypothetical protein
MPSSSTDVDETETSRNLFGANPSLNRHHFMCSPASDSSGTQTGVDPLPDGTAAPQSMSGSALDTAVVLSSPGAVTIGSSVTTGGAPSTTHPSLSPQTDLGAGGHDSVVPSPSAAMSVPGSSMATSAATPLVASTAPQRPTT